MSNEAILNGMEMEDDDPEVSDSELESEDEEDVKSSMPSKTAVYNKEGLLDKLGDINWPANVEWTHKLSIKIDQEQDLDVNDDLTRELAFYTQALEGARQAYVKFQSAGLPFLRPTDYYAEMVKSDSHMEKVKGRLLAEKRKAEETDERRKARDNKKLAKEVQSQKQKERTKQKKDEIESVKKWRKQRQQTGFPAIGKDDGDLSFAFDDGKSFERSNKKRPGVSPGDRSGGKARPGVGGKGNKGFDRKKKDKDRKDSKFGFGGRKGMKKQNTAETTNDFRAFKSSFPSKKKQKR